MPPTTAALCACHHRPIGDNATLCPEGTDELTALLRRIGTTVARGDREPARRPVARRTTNGQVITRDDGLIAARLEVAPGGYARLPSSPWDTPSGEVGNIPRVLDEQAARLAVRRGLVIGRAPHADIPIPVDLRAMHDAGTIRVTVGHWAATYSGHAVPLDAAWDVATVADWLADHTPTIRHRDWANLMLTDVRRAVARADRAVDAPPTRHYLGVCGHVTRPPLAPCPGQVFSIDEAPRGACNRCTALHDVQERRGERLAQLTGVRLTAAEIERVTTELGCPVNRKTIDKWHERGRITRDDQKRYLVDDVLRLTEKTSPRRATTTAA